MYVPVNEKRYKHCFYAIFENLYTGVLNIIGASVAKRYSSGLDKIMRLRRRNNYIFSYYVPVPV
jgi:hypothetical protein